MVRLPVSLESLQETSGLSSSEKHGGISLKDRFNSTCVSANKSENTRRSYWRIASSFIRYHRVKCEDALLENPERKLASFISAEARRGVSASTQSVSFNALIFLYQRVLGIELGTLPEIERAKRPARLPGVPATHADTMAILSRIDGEIGLALRLTYGTAMRVSETLRLRIRDIDFARGEIRIHSGKGAKDGVVGLPESLADELHALVQRRRLQHQCDSKAGNGWVHLPGLLAKKYSKAAMATEWQYVFGARGISIDPVTGNRGRHHLTPAALQQAMRIACAGGSVKLTPEDLRVLGLRHLYPGETRVDTLAKSNRSIADVSEILNCYSDTITT